eukprot:2524695-Rhodomonas_salina.4
MSESPNRRYCSKESPWKVPDASSSSGLLSMKSLVRGRPRNTPSGRDWMLLKKSSTSASLGKPARSIRLIRAGHAVANANASKGECCL